MYKGIINKALPHVLAIVFFVVISIIYFSPVLQNKTLNGHDSNTWKGASEEVRNFKNSTGETSLWTNSMFGGLPTYLINTPNEKNIITKFSPILKLHLMEPVSHVFFYLLGFYLALLVFRVKPWLAVAGAVAFGFSSYFFIILAAGHISKAIAIGYMAPIIAGVFLSFDRKPIKGALLMAFFLALQIQTNHMQIVYYTFLILLIFGIFWLYKSFKNKELVGFAKSVGATFAGLALAIGINASVLYLTYEYGKYSIRGASELTHDQNNQTSGLDKDYATGWSYGIDETFTFLIPNFKGGSSSGSLNENSETYKLFEQAQGKTYAKKVVKQLPMYWGTQPSTSGPVYVGAIICFLFILGLFVVKGPIKWWLLSATVLSILLSWGHNFSFLTNLFLDYFPGYNKFRTVSMTLVIAEFTMPLLAILAVAKVFSGELAAKEFKKSLYWAFGITGGLSFFFILFSGIYSYAAPSDAGMQQVLVDALRADRQMLLRNDAFRSLLFVLLTAILVWMGYEKKISANYLYPALILLLLLDMWPVNKRYLNNDSFVNQKAVQQEFAPTQADQYLLKDKDPDFRVLNLTVSTFNDATTSFYHKSIGGYHGAKMRRYQELIDFHIFNEIQDIVKNLQNQNQDNIYGAVASQPVLNMLNTKYIIVSPESFPIYNSGSLGNAWFVKSIKQVDDADKEIAALGSFDPKTEAVVDKKFADQLPSAIVYDSTATIKLEVYKPNYLKFTSKTLREQAAVFSEIYYPKGWNVYIDGKPAEYFRANYVLRAMVIPQGNHEIEWKFDPKGYAVGNILSIISAIILILMIVGVGVQWYLEQRKRVKS
ncbi:MAG TPA: hypothetical protein DEH15_21535 [Marinilabiliales bacterium]|nr:hypothetical protein [Marinilabiliales bacterium]